MAFSVPSLTRICVATIVKNVKSFCYGIEFEDLGRFKYIVGPLDNLSSRCIEAIFEYVICTKQLNTSWLSVLIVPHLRRIDFKRMPSGITTQLFKMLVNRCELLERLIIPNCKKISNNTLSKLLVNNSSLLELDISNKLSPKVDFSVIKTIACSCRCLTVLKLSEYQASDPQILLLLCAKRAAGTESKIFMKDDTEDLSKYDESCTVLRVENCDGVYGCLELEVLSLDNVNVNDQVMAVLLQYLTKLRELILCDISICNPWRLLDPSCCPHLLQLEELDIKSTTLLPTSLELISKFYPDLHRFSISTTVPPCTYANIGKLTSVADLEIIGGQGSPCEREEIFNKGIGQAIRGIGEHLRLLNLAYCSYIEFEVIPQNCPQLEQLNMSCAFVSFKYPCDSLGDHCRNFRSLNLAHCHIQANKEAVDDPQPVLPSEALQSMIGQPLKLAVLYVSGLAVNDETLKSFFPCDVHPLQVLNLSCCTLTTVNAIEYVWSKCPYLHTIDLTHCRGITVDDFTLLERRFYVERPQFKSKGQLIWK